MQLKIILCPIDFSEFSVTSYDYAKSLAEHYQANLIALRAIELRKYPYADYVPSTGDFASWDLVRSSQSTLDRIEKETGLHDQNHYH